jgi:putative ABC transport system ATP-binding protein
VTTVDQVIRLEAVTRRYGRRGDETTALDAVTLGFERASFTAVMGPSGSGKSTLLHCAAGLDRPTSGSVRLDGLELAGLRERALARLRRQQIGFVFQSFNLLPELSAAENVALPLRLAGRRPARGSVARALDEVGLAGRHRARPGQLSGGQQQRVAIARALVTQPGVVFADEPTGALDSATAAGILGLLSAVVRGRGTTIVMVTHDPVAAATADRVVFLADGRIAGELAMPSAAAVADQMTRLAGPGPADPARATALAGRPSW